MSMEKYSDIFVKNHKEPCYLADFNNHQVLCMNTAMKTLLGGDETPYLGQPFYAVIRDEVEMEHCEGDYQWVIPELDWEKEPIREHRIYDRQLMQSFDATALPVSFGKDTFIFVECVPVAKEEQWSYNLEQAMGNALGILQQGKEVVSQLLQLLTEFYASDQAYLYLIDGKMGTMVLSHHHSGLGTKEIPEHLERELSMETLLSWLESHNEVGMIECDLKYSSTHSVDMELLGLLGLSTLVCSNISNKKGDLIATLMVGNRQNIGVDFCFLQAVSEFVNQELTKEAMENVEKMNYLDLLTGFYRRPYYHQRIDQLTHQPPASLGAVFANVNGLKYINQEEGYAIGDNYIKKSSQMLKTVFDVDFYRISGDEFVAFLPDVEEEDLEAQMMALQKLLLAQGQNMVAVGHGFRKGRYDVTDLLQEADHRMFINKQEYYHQNKVSNDLISDTTLRDLLHYLETEEFLVYLQPQVHLHDGSLYGAEALIRRFDKVEHKMVFPDQFIPLYEKKSVIRHVDIFVVEEVCKLLQRIQKSGQPLIPISVNLSRVTLQEYSIVDSISHICDKYQVPRDKLVIEVTERVGLIDNNVASSLIRDFQEHGFHISLDDFGCAYSNIVTLAQIHVDEVKIDKSLIDHITLNEKNKVIVESMIKMCNALGNISNLAEGIETEEQARVLSEMNCGLAQGYYYARPMPLEQFCETYIFQDVSEKGV